MRMIAFGLVFLAGAAQAASPEEVKQQLEKAYPVQVLKVTPNSDSGKRTYDVRVMQKNDGSNGAFGVTTLVVDAETGELVPIFQHHKSGYTLPDQISGDPRQIHVPRGGSTWR
jgi:Peptidase propeptide and YPEB domain